MIHIVKYYSIILLAVWTIWTGNTASAEIIEETGSLQGFLAGACPDCAYDNLISHVTEGIARDNYNIYNPLDPQTVGFGNYEEIPDGLPGDTLLLRWRELFDFLIHHEWERADNLLEESLQTYPYELVHLEDDSLEREFYILRERLNPLFLDLNDIENPSDNETGSYDYSWGVYIYAVGSLYPRITVQVVHPNDDYIAPYVAIDMFLTLDAGQLFFTTAGREVAWRGGIYVNNLSMSDPSRNGRHVFQMAHEATTDYFIDEVADVNPLMIQIHSYDTRNRTYPSAIVSAGYEDRRYSLPLYDWSGVLGGMIDRTSWIVQPEGAIGNADPVTLTEFYGTWSETRLIVKDDENRSYLIPNPFDLVGYIFSNQFNYRDDEIDMCRDHEWMIHIECDELPNCIEDSTEYDFYAGAGFPVDWDNFEAIVEYYHPMAENLRASLDTIEIYMDTEFSHPPLGLQVGDITENRVTLGWARGGDPNFESYRIYYDTIPEVGPASPFFDSNDIELLCWQLTNRVVISDLLYDQDYYFALSALDRFGHESELTDIVTAHTPNTPRVVAPTGGEFWDYRQTQLVQWAGEFGNSIKIELNRDFPDGDWEILAEGLEDDGEEEIVLGDPLSEKCRIRIQNELTQIEAVSAENFRISSMLGYLQVENIAQTNEPLFEWDAGSLECPDHAELSIQVSNRGYTSIAVLEPYLAIDDYFELMNECLTSVILQPESTAACTMMISFDAELVGNYQDNLRIPTTAINAINNILSLPVAAERIITVSPPEIVLSKENNSIRLSWDPIASSIQGCPVSPTYRVWYYEDEWANRYYLGDTTDSTFVHGGILNNKFRLFYEVHVVDIE